MTKAICFYNNGTLDHRAFTMLGLSAKQDDKAIGFFGTGFKYAIATLLRNDCKVQVCAGKINYDFRLVPSTFRGKKVDFIYYNDGTWDFELPFTGHLGANWKLWQAYRELYTNALDEGGGVQIADFTAPPPGDVCVYVHSDEFAKIYDQHAKYFLKAETLAENFRLRCVEKIADSDNCVYYKTMYTGTKLDKPTHFTYDYVQSVELTEDRTIADTWSLRHHISHLWLESMNYDMLVEHLPAIANEKMYENQLSSDYCTPSDDFNRACDYLNKRHKSMPLWARDAYNRSRPFNEQVEHFTLNKWQRAKVNRAEKVLHHNGCPIDIDAIVFCASLPDDILGLYKNGIIYIAKEAFERGFTALLGTMYEEWLHSTTRCEDSSQRMQNLLVDRVAVLMEQVYDIEQEMK